MDSIRLNLKKLHDPADSRFSLILCKPKHKKLVTEVIKKETYKIVVNRYKTEYFPLYLIQNLEEVGVTMLAVNNSASRPVKAICKLNTTLCKILGALSADGHITTKSKPCYIIQITDGDLLAIKAFNKWIHSTFGREYKIEKYERNKAWRISINNKIIARIFVNLLNFPVNKKSSSIFIPTIIKEADIELKKAFLQGILTFDAGVNLNENIEFLTRSKNLFEDVVELLNQLNMTFVYKGAPDKNGFYRFHTYNLCRADLEKWLNLFEPYTEKWWKIYDIINGFSKVPFSEEEVLSTFEKVFPSKNRSITTLSEVYLVIKNKKKLTIEELAEQLNVSGDTTIKYRNLLKKCEIIKEKSIKTGGSRIQILFNKDMKTWRIPWRPNADRLQQNRI